MDVDGGGVTHPENERIRPLKKGPLLKGNSSSKHLFSGDMLVFKGVLYWFVMLPKKTKRSMKQ